MIRRLVESKPLGLTLLLIVAVGLPFVLTNFRVFQFTQVLIYAIALLGLNILTGYNGQISLGHGAFYAIGAYCTAILMDKYGVPYWATIPVAGAVCLVAGFLFEQLNPAAPFLMGAALMAVGFAMTLLVYRESRRRAADLAATGAAADE